METLPSSTHRSKLPDTRLPLRAGLARERERAWQRLAAPGTWWAAGDRLAIAAEARNAPACALCRERAAALSPRSVQGRHAMRSGLPEPVIEVIHSIVTDAGRLTRGWYERVIGSGLEPEQYVETVGIVALLTALDTLDVALGLPLRDFPAPLPGAPSRVRPGGARIDLAWVPTVVPEAMMYERINPYAAHGEKNIHQALSLVPQEVLNFFDLDVELYLRDDQIRDFDTEHRALTHSQMEFLAGRISALNRCYYWTVSHSALLRASSESSGTAVRLASVIDGADRATGVALAVELETFARAVLDRDPERCAGARDAIRQAAGEDAVIDAAAIVASFNAVVKIADGTGIPLEPAKAAATEDLRAALDLDGWAK